MEIVYKLIAVAIIACVPEHPTHRYVYSQTSDSGPSEIGTQYNKPLYKGRFSRSQIFGLPMVLIHCEPQRRGQPLYKGLEFIVPKVSFVRRFD